jgi:PEP-CTERM motif
MKHIGKISRIARCPLGAVLLAVGGAVSTWATLSPPSSGLVAWYRSDLGVTTNSFGVSAWADQSGSGNNATQTSNLVEATMSTQTIGKRVGQPVVAFTGGQNMIFTLPNANTYSGMTVIFVASPGSSQSGYEVVVGSDTTGTRTTAGIRWAFGVGSAGAQGLGWSGTDSSLNLGNGISMSPNAFLMNAYRKDTTNWNVYASRDDLATEFTDNLTSGTHPDTSFPTGTFNGVLGGEQSDAVAVAYQLEGYIGEVLIYDHALNPTEFASAISYLDEYYFVPEPSTVLLLGLGGLLLWRRMRR